ncbi:putative amidohydrolase [Paenibacillus phyllosphaerae]|uniref:Putative amidohydrolase n=1 Tax=Paenibacillus phyllosphaerae TaxID=274593 RepID=A0A7W5FPI1_9BACL|nr:carbon-nitrogen hydrolase family protein [Paenibacillus phyllosphaerae]MBB3112257.1 putative amidohydrolase [Paenibacillus phyllosphaerae]
MQEDRLPTQPLRVAAAQAISQSGDIAANVDRAVAMIAEAAQKDADIVQFPEKYLTGYVPEIIVTDPDRYAVRSNDPRLAPIREACKRHKIAAIVGSPTLSDEGLHISSIVIGADGTELSAYHKTHLFHSEIGVFRPDPRLSILTLKGWKIGLGICYDAGFPEHARALAQAGCHVYMVSSLFSKGGGYLESRIWFPARALDNTVYAVMTNHAGKTGVWDACGASGIWSPMGQLIVAASESEAELIVADLHPEALQAARKAEHMLADSVGIRHAADDIVEIGMDR